MNSEISCIPETRQLIQRTYITAGVRWYASAPDKKDDTYVVINSDTEFAHLVDGRKQEEVCPVIDELMDTIHTIYPRL